MARRYLSEGGVDLLLIGGADALVGTPWARERIGRIAAALLGEHGTLSRDEIGVRIAADA
jgi:hypothetical protein